MTKREEIFSDLEKALWAYHLESKQLPVQLVQLLNELEFVFADLTEEENLESRLTNFLDVLFQKIFKMDKLPNWIYFWELSLVQFLDTYFQTQIEHHGFHVLAAKEILADPEMLENPEYWLNSAHPSEVHTVEYYQKLLACQTLWRKLSAEARQKAKEACFPLPIRV
jgi:hypothetical protein